MNRRNFIDSLFALSSGIVAGVEPVRQWIDESDVTYASVLVDEKFASDARPREFTAATNVWAITLRHKQGWPTRHVFRYMRERNTDGKRIIVNNAILTGKLNRADWEFVQAVRFRAA